MYKIYEDVAKFHTATDTPVCIVPAIPAVDRVGLRIRLISEEVNDELLPLLTERSNDLVAVADAIADSIYVLIGTALEYGIPLPSVWNIIQNTNMAKLDPATGKVTKREDGKVLKPDGWQPPEPEIFICLKEYGWK